MWSGPRNISTALMRSFGARSDAWVVDEPFYAAYLAGSGADHPMRSECLAAQPHDWREVVPALTGEIPHGRTIFYQKHMTHHMLPGFGRDWMAACRNAFLIRAPEQVLASYVQKRGAVELADIGFVQQAEIFDREAQRLGRAPPVVEGRDVLTDPAGMLSRLCAALGLPWTTQMLSWAPGGRETDGVWGPAWYDAVVKSTGFEPPPEDRRIALPDDLQRIADLARPHYAALAKWKISSNSAKPA